jgi:hypothetical protein
MPRKTPAGARRSSLEYLDPYLVVVAAPIAMLRGAPAAGYAIRPAGAERDNAYRDCRTGAASGPAGPG